MAGDKVPFAEEDSMKMGLLADEDRRAGSGVTTLNYGYVEEVKRIGFLAGPMVAVNFSQYFLQVISVMMVGHLGELWLSSSAIAVSFCAVTGFSLLFGMASVLEPLCGQAYGAQQYGKLGNQTYGAIFCLMLVCIPLSILWIYMGDLLTLIGQDPQISHEAGKFAMWLLPAMYAYATFQPLVRFFQAQSLIIPMLVSSCYTFCFHIFLCWALVFKFGLGNNGAAFAISISYWLNVLFLVLYLKYSSSCEKTRVPKTMDLFKGIREFFHFAIPSAFMICLEWWSFELLTMLSGLLPNPKLETSVLSVCLAITSALYPIPEGLGAAASTRISNELGAGNAKAAGRSAFIVMLIVVSESVLVSATLFTSGHVFGYVFSNEKEVVDYVTAMAPLLCISVILDSLCVTLSGIARGSGWQDLGAYINLVAYYFCGVPIAILLGFWLQLRGKGLWMGMQAGALLQSVLLFIITSCTDWEKKGLVDEAKVDSFNIPIYYPSSEKVIAIVEKQGWFKIEQIQEIARPMIQQLSKQDIEKYALFVRGWAEVVVRDHFGVEIVDKIFNNFTEKLMKSGLLSDPSIAPAVDLFVLLMRTNN
ncbi:hypothetical protein SLEP1_g50309 [Rubroshorea leprosula]|uniref:Protein DETOXIFICATION n=1 Tax=Rubroshorea leprosula TaxID=152421 RepID=A0AAV5LZU9_9ROSI|nr:hypothetical protein SLEP1_g50309 [Rubroshorea leprosula]